jgi:hypothetical protein
MDRLGAALDERKSPRLAALFFSIILPGVISAPTWIKKVLEPPGLLGIDLPSRDAVAALIPTIPKQNLALIGGFAVSYLCQFP